MDVAALLPASSPAVAALRHGGRLVVSGQQPAYAGGPLYTLLKAAHAVALARSLDHAQAPVAALFWCASEDHDLGEADHTDVIARDGHLIRLRADLGGGRHALRYRAADAGWDALVTTLRLHEPSGLGQAWIMDHAPRSGELLGAWQMRLLTALLPGLTAVEGHTLRPAWRAAMHNALLSWPEQALATQRAAHLAAGGTDSFGPLASPPVFCDDPSGRIALTRDQALALWDTDPDRLSPGAALRPILQQAALPCSHFIAGPGELAYHAVITPLYAHLGVTPPQLVPRCRATLIPAWFRRACASRDWNPAQLPTHEPPPEAPALHALDAAIATLSQTYPSLPGSLARLHRERDRLARGITRQQHPARLGSLRAWLSPRGLPQERVLSVVQAIWTYGPGLATLLVSHAADLQRDPLVRV